MNNLFNYLKSRSKSSLAKNFFALSILQATNYIFPFITLPYVTRIFGPEVYGLLNFATSIVAYFSLIVNYGFDLSASREIAQNREDKEKIEEIFNRVLFAKILLFFAASIIFLLILFTISKISLYEELYLIMFFGSIFNVFFPTWFFQGMEKLNLTAIFTFIVRLIFTILVFIIIKSKTDYVLFPITTIIGQSVVSFISLYVVSKQFKINFFIPPIKSVINTLKEGWKIFTTTVVINLYTTTNFVILGFLATDYDVGIYSAAYKIVAISMSLVSMPLSQSLFPNIGNSFAKSRELGIIKIYKALLLVVLLTVIPSIFMFLFPQFIINILYGNTFDGAIVTLKILAFAPLIIGLSNIFGIQGLLNLKKDGYVTLVTLVGSIIGLTLNFILVPIYKYNGTAISWIITEIVITILMFAAFIKNTDFVKDVKKIILKIPV